MSKDHYPIGTQFITSGKRAALCEVIDIWKTYDSAGELVKHNYVAVHDFLGQTVRNIDLNDVAIARGIDRLNKILKIQN